MPCPPLCALVAPPFTSVVFKVPVPALDVRAWAVFGLRWCQEGGWGFARVRIPLGTNN